MPSQFVYHRYGSLPKVVMMFLPNVGSSEKWDLDSISKNKNIRIED